MQNAEFLTPNTESFFMGCTGLLTHFASFSPKSYLAAAAESESAKQELHTTLQHLQH